MSDMHYGTEARMLEAEMERRAVARRANRPRFELPAAPTRHRLPTRLRGWRSV
jgi:hypothetical protein